MVALSICVFTVVKVFHAPGGAPESQLTPASSSSLSDGTGSTGQPPALPELSEQTRQQLQAPPKAGSAGALPDGSGAVSSPDVKAPDLKSPDSNPDAKPDSRPDSRPDFKAQGARAPQNAQNVVPRGPDTRAPSVRSVTPGRAAVAPGSAPAQRSAPATGRDAQGSNGSNAPEAAEDPDTAAPAEPPRVIYVPETPEERDARMRRELADSVCDQYGVAREACRARTARR